VSDGVAEPLSPETSRRGRRDAANRRGAGAGVKGAIPQLPRRKVARAFPPMSIISADEVESIHRASLKVLSEIGMDFNLPEARDLLKKAGADISGERVRFDPAMIEELMKSAPSQFTFHARNPENTTVVGGPNMLFGAVGSPRCSDMEGRRHRKSRGLPQVPEACPIFQLH
jgi:trimethylamine--corrinoid protein Co-methyltransferase